MCRYRNGNKYLMANKLMSIRETLTESAALLTDPHLVGRGGNFSLSGWPFIDILYLLNLSYGVLFYFSVFEISHSL